MIYDRSISTVSENGKSITLVGLTIPLLFEQIFLLLYGTVNTIILSGYSDIAVSATGVAQQINNLAVAILSMVNKGTVIVISVAMGAKNRGRAAAIAGSGMYLALGISTVLACVLYGFARPLMGMMNLSGELQNTAAHYLGVVGILMPVAAMLSYVNNLLNEVEYNHREQVYPLIYDHWIPEFYNSENPYRFQKCNRYLELL